MFGLGIWEIAAIVLVAVIVIRPRDLPGFIRNVGRLYRKALVVYRDVTRTLRETGQEIRRQVDVESGSDLDRPEENKDDREVQG